MSGTVALDLSCLEVEPETGVERYARRLVEHLPRVAPDLDFTILHRPGGPVPVVVPPAKLAPVPSILPRAAWRETAMPKALARLGIGVLHSPVAAIPFRTKARRIATLHHVPPFGSKGHEGRLSRNRLRLDHALLAADRIIVPSAATKEALLARAPTAASRIVVIPHGVDPDFRPVGVPLQRERYGIPPGPYVLWVGTIRERKDPLVLVEAFARAASTMPEDLHLVMSGDIRMDHELLRAPLRAVGMATRLVLPGYVAREDLPDLYREAMVVVFPSRLEGFGLPALEAMASGRPLVVSSDAALGEVVGDAAPSFRTGDAADLARVLRHLFRDEGERFRLAELGLARSQGFSWTGSAKAHAAVYRELLALPGHGR